jgi:hypothetical protein
MENSKGKNKIVFILILILLLLISYCFFLKIKFNNINMLIQESTINYPELVNDQNIVTQFHCYHEQNNSNNITVNYQEITINNNSQITSIVDEDIIYYLTKKDYQSKLNNSVGNQIVSKDDIQKKIVFNNNNQYLTEHETVNIVDYINYLGDSYLCGG